jgi:hypothetical protein
MGTKAPSAVVFSATLRTRFEKAKDNKNSRVFKGISLLFNDEEPGYPSGTPEGWSPFPKSV